MKKVAKTLLIVFNYAVLVAVLLSYLAPYVNPKTSWVIAFFGLSFKAWLLALVCCTFFGWLLRTKLLVKNLVVLIIGIPFIFRVVSIHKSIETEGNVKVASFNTYALGQYNKLNTSESIDSLLENESIDMAAFMEWRFQKGRISKKKYPYQVKIRNAPHSNNGILLVSKHPIIASGLVPFTKSSYNMAGYMDVKVQDKVIRVYGIHLETTRIKSRDYHSLKQLEFDSVYTENAKSVVQRLKLAMEIRASQVEDITKHMADCPHPSIVMGDFNDTPQSYTYQQLRSGKTDAFVHAGKGFEATFLKPFPFLRIDFILVDKSFQVTNYQSTDAIYSDHKLIFASLKTN